MLELPLPDLEAQPVAPAHANVAEHVVAPPDAPEPEWERALVVPAEPQRDGVLAGDELEPARHHEDELEALDRRGDGELELGLDLVALERSLTVEREAHVELDTARHRRGGPAQGPRRTAPPARRARGGW